MKLNKKRILSAIGLICLFVFPFINLKSNCPCWIRNSNGINYYVSSSIGIDSNDGVNATHPFATLAKAISVAKSGSTINLKRGDTWNEQLTITCKNLTIKAYGIGERPIIDCSESCSAETWVEDDTFPGQYHATLVTGTMSGEPRFLSMKIGGLIALRYADRATLAAATSGYYAVNETASTSIDCYVRMPDGTSPTGNALSLVYNKRLFAVYAYNIDGITVMDIEARFNGAEGGGIKLGKYAKIYRTKVVDGNKHSVFLGDGAYTEDLEMVDSYYNLNGLGADTQCNPLVNYDVSGLGLGSTHVRPVVTFNIPRSGSKALFGHTAAGSLGSITYLNPVITNVDAVCGTMNCTSETIVGGTYLGYITRIGLIYTHLILDGVNAVTSNNCVQANVAGSSVTIQNGCVLQSTSGGVSGVQWTMRGLITASDSTFVQANAGYGIYSNAAGCVAVVNRCIFTNASKAIRAYNTASYSGDYNVLGANRSNMCMFASTGYSTLATWQAAATPNDANSTN